MTKIKSTILTIGAAGQFASLVMPELAKRGGKVRGLIRDAKQGAAVIKSGAAEVAVGDLNDRTSLNMALKGVGSVFYIAPAFMPNEVAIGKGMVLGSISSKLLDVREACPHHPDDCEVASRTAHRFRASGNMECRL